MRKRMTFVRLFCRILLPGYCLIFGTVWASTMKLPQPEVETLPNGLQLVWFVKDTIPVVDVSLFIKAGHRDDPTGKSGTVELLAASLDRGAGGLNAQQIADAVEKMGASRFANVDDDFTTVGVHGLALDATALVDILGKLVLKPEFKETEVLRERARMADRWDHLEDYSEALVSLAYQRALTSNTSYNRGSLAALKELNAVTQRDVIGFHQKYFVPKNCVLAIVGKVDRVEFKKKILSTFGNWQGDLPKREWRDYADAKTYRKNDRMLIIDRPDLNQAQVRLGFRAPLIQVPEHHALLVANALLGEYFNSRLNSLIRDKLGLTYSIHSAFSHKKDFGDFTVAAATRNEAVGQLVRRTLEVLRNFKKGPIPAQEVEMGKTFLQGAFPLGTSTLNAVGSKWMLVYLFGLESNYLDRYVDQIGAVTPEQVQAAVNKYFDLDHLIIAVAGDASKIKKSLEETEIKPIRYLSVSDLK